MGNGMVLQEPQGKLLDPTIDVVFKIIFADEKNKPLLISLLTSVMKPSIPIREVEILNPEIPKEFSDDKGVILDIHVKLADGSRIDVEMQTSNFYNIRPRALYYWARTYSQQLKRGKIHTYSKLCPTVCILILNYVEFRDCPQQLHSIFELKERTRGTLFLDHQTIHFIELPKLAEKDRKQLPILAGELEVSHWAKFLTFRNEKELEELAMAHPTMRQAKSALASASTKKGSRQAAESRRKALLDYQSAMIDATELAEAKGRAEGEANTFRKFVLAMYRQGMSASKIAQAILQPVDTIQSIIDELKKH